MSFSMKLGNHAAKMLPVLLFAGLWNLFLPEAACADAHESKIKFHWAFVALVGNGGNRVLEPIEGDTFLRSGDQFKMMVKLESHCYVYVIYRNAQDGVKLLFPYTLDQFEHNSLKHERHYIPTGDAWFERGRYVGRESFYLVASPVRLVKLEEFFVAYESADAVERSEIIREISLEIQNLKKQSREDSALKPWGRKPLLLDVPSVEREREPFNQKPDIATLSRQFVISDRAFVKRYNIHHQ